MKDRLGRCYELAGRRVARSGGGEILVHGTIQGMGHPPNPHAWVMVDGDYGRDANIVWEPVSDTELPWDVFERLFSPAEHRRYTVDEVNTITLKTGHWGPWEEQE